MNATLRKTMKRIAKRLPASDDPLTSRARLTADIAEKRDGDLIYIYMRSRDCDQFEADGISEVKAHPFAFERWVNEQHEWAEGPILELCILSRTERDAYYGAPPIRIDHAAEAANY